MPAIFNKLDKAKPAYDMIYKIMLFICKLLLTVDILLAIYAVLGRYISLIPNSPWTEEIILTLMSYMVVLSAALAIRRSAHIRMTAFDIYLPHTLLKILDLLADICILVLAFVMITVGWEYAITIGAKASYTSLPNLSRFWKYFPVPVAGVTMLIFEIEAICNHIKAFWVKEENK